MAAKARPFLSGKRASSSTSAYGRPLAQRCQRASIAAAASATAVGSICQSGMPPPTPAPAFSGASATIASVVRMFFAIDAAFCSAERTTIVGSVIPDFMRSSYTPVSTFSPWPLGA